MLGLHAFADASHQQGDIGALATPVGVQFVEHQERQTAAVIDDAAIDVFEARENQLQHHEVGEQNVGRVVGDGPAFLAALLAGIALDGERRLPDGVAMQELVEFLELAVRQRVHRVDDDGARARCRVRLLGLQDVVDDRDEERQRLARAGAGGDDVALAVVCLGDGLHLVDVEMQVCGLAFDLAGLEQGRACGMQATLPDQFLNGAAALVVGIDLDQRFGPVAAEGVFLLNLVCEVCGGDLREAAREGAVLVDQAISKLKDVLHATYSLLQKLSTFIATFPTSPVPQSGDEQCRRLLEQSSLPRGPLPHPIAFARANGFPAGNCSQLFAAWRAAGWQVLALAMLGHDPRFPVGRNWPRVDRLWRGPGTRQRLPGRPLLGQIAQPAGRVSAA